MNQLPEMKALVNRMHQFVAPDIVGDMTNMRSVNLFV